ncbi:MAG: hypothetical protein NG740_05990 [Omnitrophica bacterium]|nr:hypothetical protein [Candidatus Omnitrophota bacterium]
MARDLRARLNREELRRLYLDEKKSLEDIARMYGVSRVAVWKYCRAEQLTRRSRSEARLEAQRRSKVPQKYYHINENFFSQWSREMAYVLGLLMTDGCLNRPKNSSFRIRLCLNDRELLEKVANVIGSNHNITASRHQEGLYSLLFAREKLAQDLIKLGLKLRKSLDLEFPELPNEYLRDFIRGVFDGDGSVYFNKKSPNCPLVTKFVGGSRPFMYKLEQKLQGLGMPKRKIYEERRKNVSYTIRYSHKNSLKLGGLMYSHIDSDLYLKRKYIKFKKGAGNGKAD